MSNNDIYHIVSGDFNAHTATFSDIVSVSGGNELLNDASGYFSATEDICDILRKAGFSEDRCNQHDTPHTNSNGKKTDRNL